MSQEKKFLKLGEIPDLASNGNGHAKTPAAKKLLKVDLPAFNPTDLGQYDTWASEIETEVETLRNGTKTVTEGIAAAFEQLRKAREFIDRFANDPEKQLLASRKAKPTIEGAETYINSCLTLSDEILLAAAQVAYLRAVLSGDFATYQQAFAALHELDDKGILQKSDRKNPCAFKLGYQWYNLKIKVTEETRNTLRNPIEQMANRLHALEKEHRTITTAQMRKHNTITLEDLLYKKASGKVSLTVPAELTDKPRPWNGGGEILIESDGHTVKVLQASGSFERVVKKMIERGVFLTLLRLREPKCPRREELQIAAEEKLGIAAEESEIFAKEQQLLWHFIRRTSVWQNEQERSQQKDVYLKSATITPEQFFDLEEGSPSEGIAFLEFPGILKLSNQAAINHIFLLVERIGSNMKLVDIPQHLEKLLGDLIDQEYPLTDDLTEMPEMLRDIVKATRDQAEMKVSTVKGSQE